MTITSTILLAIVILAAAAALGVTDELQKSIDRLMRKEKLRKAREAKKTEDAKIRWDVYKNRARELQKKKQIKIICKNPALAEVFEKCV